MDDFFDTIYLLAGISLITIGYLNLSILASDKEGIERNINRRVKDILITLALSGYVILLVSVSGLLHALYHIQQTEFLLITSIIILWIVILYINSNMVINLWKEGHRPKFRKELVDCAFYIILLWIVFERLDIDIVSYSIPIVIFVIILFYVTTNTSRYARMVNVLVFPVSVYNFAISFGIFTILSGFVLIEHATVNLHAGFVLTSYLVFSAGLIDLYIKLRTVLSTK
jgi:hypothetical protein